MKKYLLIISLFLFNSCSTIDKSQLYGAIGGTLIGGFLGKTVGQKTSPNKQSQGVNGTIGMILGSLAGAGGGYWLGGKFFKDDPENFKGPEIPLDRDDLDMSPRKQNKKQKSLPLGLKLSDLKINTTSQISKVYKVPTSEKVPSKFKGQVQKQIIIEHKIPNEMYELPNGGTAFFNNCSVTETRFVKQK